ncbi:MAG TPA: hypothetical protein VL490_02750 [Mucilaginibacter sp.]|jgi:hypothetical protein|nr:hypothetical protein [Mucilaginibacter sp.]
MENKKQVVKWFVPIGLLLIFGVTLIDRFITPLPDSSKGLLMGAGIGIMIVGLIKQRQLKSAN